MLDESVFLMKVSQHLWKNVLDANVLLRKFGDGASVVKPMEVLVPNDILIDRILARTLANLIRELHNVS